MSLEYTIYTLRVVGSSNRGYQIQSDAKTDKKLISSKATHGDQEILDLVWSFLGEPDSKDILPGGVQFSSALRKHLMVERDPDFGEFLYIQDRRTLMPLLKLEERTTTLKPLAVSLPKSTRVAIPAPDPAVAPQVVAPRVSDEEVARNRRLVELVATLLKKTSPWRDSSEVNQQQAASAMVSAALKDEQFEEILAEMRTSNSLGHLDSCTG
ncbi:hypothetical protein [Candidatus Cyanaurora vandensis]|uniref:hypothetical protein n=1 Tax=Candidatus Cyanaurora vandensis TaxID=2714958 RepID=UPI002579AFEE|nr:hypothetical protein [Candidatus Cyanaurora vandensis]